MFWNLISEPVPTKLKFEPTLDITPYELAFILSKTMHQPVQFQEGAFEKITPNIQRHFRGQTQ